MHDMFEIPANQYIHPGNRCDTRIIVIGRRALGFVRLNRPNDFRASGSGRVVYDPNRIDCRCVEIAFHLAERLGSQSLGFDFILDHDQQPRICEMSYAYPPLMVHACPGYWDRKLGWHEGQVWPQDAILEDVLAALAPKKEGCLTELAP